MITLTETAAREVARIRAERKLGDEKVLRVQVVGGGCSGFQYNLFFDDAAKVNEETDEEYDFEYTDESDATEEESASAEGGVAVAEKVKVAKKSVRVVIDRKSDILMNGTIIDWHDGLNGRGFAFSNPNATKSCGCGSSFSA